MGKTDRWDPKDWSAYSTKTASTMHTSGSAAVFTSKKIDDYLNPATFAFRESRDSAINPASTPIMLFCDVTGSMGHTADTIITKSLGVIMQEIIDRKPVTDPHLLCGAIGDAYFDRSPLQVTQFECDMTLTQQIERIHIEKGGGSNHGESYNLAWMFAAMKVKADAFEKRKAKGFLFTMGDEPMLPTVERHHAKKFLDVDLESDLSSRDLLTMINRDWHVFHLNVKGGHDQITWKELLGQHWVLVDDLNKLGEVVVSIIQVITGESVDAVSKSWSGDTSMTVAKAVKNLVAVDVGSAGSVSRL